jgi:polyhydroxyalkanoate synthesis regulator phasin
MEEASVEDRVADAILGPETEDSGDDLPEETPEAGGDEIEPSSETPEDDSGDEPEAKEEAPEVFEVELDGQLYEVPKSIKDAIDKASDYTQKTQSLAAERKEVEIVRSRVEQFQKQYEFASSIANEAAQVQTLEYQIQQGNQYLKENLANLSDKEILQLRFQIDEAKQQRDQLQQQLQAKYGEFQQAQEQSLKELLDKSTGVLRSRIPNWDKVKDEVVGFARELGFTENEVSQALADPRQMQIAHDAMRYRQLKANTSTAVAKVEKAIQPKSRNPMPDDVKRKLNLRKQIKTAKSPRERERLIQEDVANRLGL